MKFLLLVALHSSSEDTKKTSFNCQYAFVLYTSSIMGHTLFHCSVSNNSIGILAIQQASIHGYFQEIITAITLNLVQTSHLHKIIDKICGFN